MRSVFIQLLEDNVLLFSCQEGVNIFKYDVSSFIH